MERATFAPYTGGSRRGGLARQMLQQAWICGLRQGDQLPDQVFATIRGVSRTSFLATFRKLAEEILLPHEPGADYRPAVDPEAGAEPLLRRLDRLERPLAVRALADPWARRRDDALSVAALSRRYGVPRHSVLNALSLLQHEGIVAHATGQSRSSRPVLDTLGALADSRELRLMPEPQAILGPGFSLDQARARRNRLDMC